MDIEQLIIGVVLLVVFYGVIKWVARVVAWGLIAFVGIPFVLSGPVAGVDWSETVDDLRVRLVDVIHISERAAAAGLIDNLRVRLAEIIDPSGSGAGNDVRVTLTEGDGRCGPIAPLRFGIWNDAQTDVARVTYQLSYRPEPDADEMVFRSATSDHVVPAGQSTGTCIARPGGSMPGDVYLAEVTGVEFVRQGG